ncbi:MAG: hypothetical protein WCJ84_02920 [Candidatus Peregrinibacteria bacterium]
MTKFFQEYGILIGAIFFSIVFFFGGHPEYFSASIAMPFTPQSAGIEYTGGGHNLATEAGHDSGVEQIGEVTSTIFLLIKSLLGVIAVGWLVYTGVMMVATGTNEDQITKGKHMATYTILGLMTMLLVEPMVMDVFYGGGAISTATTGIGDITNSYANFNAETRAVVSWVEAILVFIAMAYLIFAGLSIIFAFGEEDDISAGKKMIFPIGFGLLIIALKEVVVDQIIYRSSYNGSRVLFDVGENNANVFIKELLGLVQYFLFFVAAIAFGFLVYGGFLYVISFGDEEKSESGKKMFINAAIGLIIILISFALTYTLVGLKF